MIEMQPPDNIMLSEYYILGSKSITNAMRSFVLKMTLGKIVSNHLSNQLNTWLKILWNREFAEDQATLLVKMRGEIDKLEGDVIIRSTAPATAPSKSTVLDNFKKFIAFDFL